MTTAKSLGNNKLPQPWKVLVRPSSTWGLSNTPPQVDVGIKLYVHIHGLPEGAYKKRFWSLNRTSPHSPPPHPRGCYLPPDARAPVATLVCMYVRTHVRMHVCMYAYTHIYISYMYIYIFMCTHFYMPYVHAHVSILVYMCIHV